MTSKRSYSNVLGNIFMAMMIRHLMSEVIKAVKEKKLTISAAESLTGGMFQKELTAIPGAGQFIEGWSGLLYN